MSDATCTLCGGADPLRLGLCPACGPRPRATDSVVFVDAGAPAAARVALHGIFGDAVGAGAGRVAAGRVPLLRLPRGLADRAVMRLSHAGLPVRAVPAVAAWTRMPWHFFLMVGLVILTGTIAGVRAAPALMWTTPLFAALLGVAAQEGMRRPALTVRARPGLGASARAVAAAALADLPEGAARALLAELVRLGDRLLAEDRRAADVDDLVVSAAATAREVALLEEARAALEGQPGAEASAERCARMHEGGLALLRRARAALAGRTAAGGREAGEARDRLTDIVRAMEAESAAHLAATMEIGHLLERA